MIRDVSGSAQTFGHGAFRLHKLPKVAKILHKLSLFWGIYVGCWKGKLEEKNRVSGGGAEVKGGVGVRWEWL